MKAYLEAGEFVSTHGIAGELKLYPWCDAPSFLCGFTRLYLDEQGKTQLRVTSIRTHKNVCLVKAEGVGSVEEARQYIGKVAYIARADAPLEEGQVFVQDLLGAMVEDADSGRCYGHIKGITHPGRHDVYEIANDAGEIFWFPAVREFLVKVSPEEGKVLVRPIPGMFEEEGRQPTQGRDPGED